MYLGTALPAMKKNKLYYITTHISFCTKNGFTQFDEHLIPQTWVFVYLKSGRHINTLGCPIDLSSVLATWMLMGSCLQIIPKSCRNAISNSCSVCVWGGCGCVCGWVLCWDYAITNTRRTEVLWPTYLYTVTHILWFFTVYNLTFI